MTEYMTQAKFLLNFLCSLSCAETGRASKDWLLIYSEEGTYKLMTKLTFFMNVYQQNSICSALIGKLKKKAKHKRRAEAQTREVAEIRLFCTFLLLLR